MSRSALLALSAALTAFVLFVAGAAASHALRAGPPAPVAASDAIPADVVRAREAELTRRLEEANALLRERAAPPATEASPAAAAERDEPTVHEERRRHRRERDHERRAYAGDHERRHHEDHDG